MKEIVDQIKLDRNSQVPIYRQIENEISRLISQDILKANDQTPSIPSMVNQLGVNAQTIRQAYQNLSQKGLVKVVNRRGAFVADRTENKKSKIIGFLNFPSDDILFNKEEFYGAIYKGLLLETHHLGWECTHILSSRDISEVMHSKKLAGFIMISGSLAFQSIQEELNRMGAKVVAIGGGEGSYFPIVRSDDYMGMKLLMDHLFSLGHKRIGILNTPASWGNYSAYRRFEAYMQLMGSRDLDISPHWVYSLPPQSFTEKDEQEKMYKAFFGGNRCPTAIIACGFTLATSLLQTLHRFNVKVPQEVSVCGYDDIPSISTIPGLTTISQPGTKMGEVAIRNFVQLVSGKQVGDTILPVEFILRESTAAAIS
jgi:DNA-binding LacI/PurR family transcriptional regulator